MILNSLQNWIRCNFFFKKIFWTIFKIYLFIFFCLIVDSKFHDVSYYEFHSILSKSELLINFIRNRDYLLGIIYFLILLAVIYNYAIEKLIVVYGRNKIRLFEKLFLLITIVFSVGSSLLFQDFFIAPVIYIGLIYIFYDSNINEERLCKAHEKIIFSILSDNRAWSNYVVSICKEKNNKYYVFRTGKFRLNSFKPQECDAFYFPIEHKGVSTESFSYFSESYITKLSFNNHTDQFCIEQYKDDKNKISSIYIEIRDFQDYKMTSFKGELKTIIGSLNDCKN